MSDPSTTLKGFVLKDGAGTSHTYETVLLPARKGLPVSLALVKALGEPLVALLGEVGLEGEEGASPGASDVDFSRLAPTLRGLDVPVLCDLALQVLSETIRDGKTLTDHNFDKAYQGN